MSVFGRISRRNRRAGGAKVLLVCDRPNWAYDAIAQTIEKYNDNAAIGYDRLYLKTDSARLRSASRQYDLVFMLGWQLLLERDGKRIRQRFPYLDRKRVITGIHSHHAWDDRRTQPDLEVAPPPELVDRLSRYAGVNVVSRRLYELFLRTGLRGLACTLNGVDTEIFRSEQPIREDGPLRVGFSGNKKHDWRKGVTEYIQPACDMDGVELKLAMLHDDRHVPLEEMYRFYNEVDIYLCASSSEGFSLSVLEASACGRPVISTRVGGSEDLIVDDLNGFLVEREVNAIRSKVKILRDDRKLAQRMGHTNRQVAQGLWSWNTRIRSWLAFIESNLK